MTQCRALSEAASYDGEENLLLVESSAAQGGHEPKTRLRHVRDQRANMRIHLPRLMCSNFMRQGIPLRVGLSRACACGPRVRSSDPRRPSGRRDPLQRADLPHLAQEHSRIHLLAGAGQPAPRLPGRDGRPHNMAPDGPRGNAHHHLRVDVPCVRPKETGTARGERARKTDRPATLDSLKSGVFTSLQCYCASER